ncbi:MAG: RecX family transcriptional regulator [Vicingaceae bacterium]
MNIIFVQDYADIKMTTNKAPFSFQEVLAKLMRFCSYQERSELEISQKAKAYGMVGDEVEELLKHLRKENFINEERFAETYVRGKLRVKKWGLYKIKQGLMAKGVDLPIISAALKTIDQDLYLENLHELAVSKRDKLSSSADSKAKLFRFLKSKGYEGDLIWNEISKHT